MRRHAPPHVRINSRRGIVIVAVLVVVTLLALAAYKYTDMMTSEYKGAQIAIRVAHARANADSGVHYAMGILSNPEAVTNFLDDNPFNNPAAFSHQAAGPPDTTGLQGYFSIFTGTDPNDVESDGGPYRFGVACEGGKINLSALMKLDKSGKVLHDMLMKLPLMTEDIADAIVDWLDPDDQPRANGAESEYYSGLTPSSRCKNGPIESLDELLLVRGVSRELLYGADRNRNGILDPDEQQGDFEVGMERGWSAYLTIYSRELNVDVAGQPRVNLNGNDLQTLYTDLTTAELDDELVAFIILYRMYGATATLPKNSKGQSSGGVNVSSLGLNKQDSTKLKKIASLYDLVTGYIAVPPADGKGETAYYASPMMEQSGLEQYLPQLLDKTTLSTAKDLYGRINVNTAPRAVLETLPELTMADVDAMCNARPALSSTDPADPSFQTPAWLLTDANLTVDKIKKIEKYITTRSQVYSMQVVGYPQGNGPAVRLEVVIDANNGQPRVLHQRDLSDLGKGIEVPMQQ